MEPAVGASVCASGSQAWKGGTASLTTKASAKPASSQVCDAGRDAPACASSNASKVMTGALAPSQKTAPSRPRPATALKMRNFIADASRWPWPHSAMSRKLGTTISSQKKARTRRSNDRKTPFDAATVHSSAAWNRPEFSVVFHEVKTATHAEAQ